MILKTAGAKPFLLAIFLNAFIDLGHKIVIQNTIFKIYDGSEQVVLTAILNASILLPYVLLFMPVGYVADRYANAKVMRACALMAVVLTMIITYFYFSGLFWPAFLMTLLMGVQSAFYSPVKYAYLKQLFGKDWLAPANGAAQAVSIIAILSGTFIFSIIFESLYLQEASTENAVVSLLVPVGVILMASSCLEAFFIWRLPIFSAENKNLTTNVKDFFSPKIFRDKLMIIWERPILRYTILGLALFFSCGQVMLAAFPAFAKMILSETNTVIIQAILASSGIGIGLGAWLAGRFSRGYIEAAFIPLGGIGFALGLCALPFLSSAYAMIACFFWVGFMGGFFIVPLMALLQFNASSDEMGQVLAGSNLIQNIAMLSCLVLTAVFSLLMLSPQWLLLLIAVVAIVGVIASSWCLPQSLLSWLYVFKAKRFRLSVDGIKQIPEKGGLLLTIKRENSSTAELTLLELLQIQKACPRFICGLHKTGASSLFQRLEKQAGCVGLNSIDDLESQLSNGKIVVVDPVRNDGDVLGKRAGYSNMNCILGDKGEVSFVAP